jgi:hypothetical protein
MVADTMTVVGGEMGLEGLAAVLTRAQLVDRIAAMNPSATPEFLARFGEQSLGNYLEHLVSAQEPRGRTARWVRRNETPAISKWEPKG